MTIKYFGKIAELTGLTSEEFSSFNSTISDFKEMLFDKHPILEGETVQIAVNLKIEEEDFVLKENDTLAILPPFSGG